MVTQAEREMMNIIAAYDGRLGSPAITIERLQLWADELRTLRERERPWLNVSVNDCYDTEMKDEPPLSETESRLLNELRRQSGSPLYKKPEA